jgi:hypothetical protein
MAKVVADISMSLDGFVTGPEPGPQRGLGRGGEALHTWALDGDAIDAGVLAEAVHGTGVVGLHLAPVVLGGGTPLFAGGTPRNLRQIHVRASGHATHLTYRVD